MGPPERLFRFDERLAKKLLGPLAGVDEAGRGPLAGPVVAAAVIFPRRVSFSDLDDSKRLSPSLRGRIFREIISQCLIGIGRVPESLIDEINILEATRLAMRQAILALPRTPAFLLVDGPIRLDLPICQQSVIGGDGKSALMAAASIVAKVYRDAWMQALDRVYPDYGFGNHKGYPTPEHLRLLRAKGATPIHRKSFRPVAEVLESNLNE